MRSTIDPNLIYSANQMIRMQTSSNADDIDDDDDDDDDDDGDQFSINCSVSASLSILHSQVALLLTPHL